MNSRREQIEGYVVDSRAELQFGSLSDRALGAATEQWYERLRFIPDDYLGECYRLAMDNHATRSPLIPKEIVDQWRIISARPGFRDKPIRQEKTCPHFCSSAGWIIVNAQDEMQKDFGSKDYQYAKPCPIHRPQGVRLDPHSPMGPRLVRPETTDQRSIGYGGQDVEGFKSVGQVVKEIIPEQYQEEIPF